MSFVSLGGALSNLRKNNPDDVTQRGRLGDYRFLTEGPSYKLEVRGLKEKHMGVIQGLVILNICYVIVSE